MQGFNKAYMDFATRPACQTGTRPQACAWWRLGGAWPRVECVHVTSLILFSLEVSSAELECGSPLSMRHAAHGHAPAFSFSSHDFHTLDVEPPLILKLPKQQRERQQHVLGMEQHARLAYHVGVWKRLT